MDAAGTYYGTPTGGVIGLSRQKQIPQMVVTFSVTHYAVDGQWQDVPPCERRVYLSLSDKAWPYTQDKLIRLGFNGNMREPAFAAKGVELVCSHDSYNGQIQVRWDLAPVGGAEIERAPDDVLRRLQALWQAKQPGYSERPAAQPAPGPVAAGVAGGEDRPDIPF